MHYKRAVLGSVPASSTSGPLLNIHSVPACKAHGAASRAASSTYRSSATARSVCFARWAEITVSVCCICTHTLTRFFRTDAGPRGSRDVERETMNEVNYFVDTRHRVLVCVSDEQEV